MVKSCLPVYSYFSLLAEIPCQQDDLELEEIQLKATAYHVRMSISTGFERPSINLLRMFQDALKSVEIGSLQVQDHLLQEQSHTHTDGSVLNSVNIDLGSADYGTDVQIIGDIDDLQKMSHRNSSLGEQALSAWRDCDKYWPLNR